MTDTQRLREAVAGVLAEAGIADADGEAVSIVNAAQRTSPEDAAMGAMEAARKRAAGAPLSSLYDRTTFMGVEVSVSSDALVPREETELLGYTALELIDSLGRGEVRAIDMCCGSGNLACALAATRPQLRVWAADLTDGAVLAARANVERLGLGDRVVVAQGDLFGPLTGIGLEGTIDLIVCNPPYISTGKLERDRDQLLSYGPREAFDGGPYGVTIFQRVLRDASAFLKPGGHLLFEIGAGQERQVSLLFRRAGVYGDVVQQKVDSQHRPRVLVGKRQ
jgi:release factor glutamine methyltransferase